MAGIVVVFDFDRTLIDGDSDNWVVTEMGLSDLFRQLRSSLPWNSLMDRMMKELHSQGKTAEEIAECLKKTPLDPRIAAAIKSAYELGCDLRIVSDANQFFIEKILEHHDLLGCFSKIYTNPTFVDEEGRLRIFPYHDSTLSPHGCSLCPTNLCKGLVLDDIYASAPEGGKQKFIYLGDGGGDYCPTLKLQDTDHVMPRKNYPLWNRIFSDPALVKAAVHEWTNGEELEKTLLHLINTISTKQNTGGSNSSQSNSSDCKLHTVVVYA
ncbi:HAD-superfamily hydrolase, subfamily IB, PSPase-like protein [Corchorus olitorius]|uniref:HAD-superfamily hydrolase, subfamily IB, PSPase-like protein n=1 Tax=Corchorus olitorius TaxID=93759 RepID=A0A1R3J9W3_9ROSI|nr:HAD-superfamily hydrolase, subfamily IB, PSPase-like protein [Corchorus olitorius]